MQERHAIHIGTAGWSIPRAAAAHFPPTGTHLERYSRGLPCVEINSSFYRSHARKVYERWAFATPEHFRFSVKLPRLITHDQRLRRARTPLKQFFDEVFGLGDKLGPLLVQLPPSFAFETRAIAAFFGMVRDEYDGAVVCEPRHASWFDGRADAMLERFFIGRVAADPAVTQDAANPGGWQVSTGATPPGIAYYRLHGSPRMYWSRYSVGRIRSLTADLSALSAKTRVWCIFDNTAAGAAIANALEVKNAFEDPQRNIS